MKHLDPAILTRLVGGDVKDYYETDAFVPQASEFREHVTAALDFQTWQKHAVLGLDIYKYSKMEEVPQAVVPVVFDLIYDEAISFCLGTEPTIFHSCDSQWFADRFISTGDGGFQILANPLQALLFAMSFQNILHLFNTYHFYPKFRSLLDSLTLRYCLTYDHVYRYKDNYYGRAIISNARVMSMDKLNRFLMDENAMDWFAITLNGIETLRIASVSNMIQRLNIPPNVPVKSLHFQAPHVKSNQSIAINLIIAQKIRQMSPKGDLVSAYNVYLQYLAAFRHETDTGKGADFVMSLGNTNSVDL